MIDLYTFPTPNGWKASIMLEEVGLPYNTHVIHIGKDEQFAPDFLKISPNNKIPAIVDPNGPDGKSISVFESGAILMYLARKTKSPLLPEDPRKFVAVTEWLMFQMGSIGPMFGQMGHFVRFAKEDVPYGKKRYTDESRRILGVMDKRLAESDYLAGDYSIADVASYGWGRSAEMMFDGLDDWSNVKRWFEVVGARPAVQKGITVPVLES
ncbi:MAG: glutathione S-transferase family protein [Rhodospirillaceae bacterium]|jgi:GST-like protein|nr:glutathione S-transferase family protein [Rhodospirillaceae bacterium]MBT5564498.1 glutathione S-transferase family protein [Rhodospirillaceae bacterium]MBT6089788.1 glutathione S-transferase family protein [Rhodospirillaceae bacterium]MBT7451691.1 glutathione S-transferase family protein [Rhodospirillaceae bacterium]